MASVAGHIANGTPLNELGTTVTELKRLEPIGFHWQGDQIATQIVAIDHFGNAVISLPKHLLEKLPSGTRLRFRRTSDGLPDFDCCVRRTYSDAAPEETIALVGSHDLVELAINCGSAARQLNLFIGQHLQVGGLKKFAEP